MDLPNALNTNCTDLDTQNKRKTEDSTSSRLKILNRGDILGAMNCIFPDMQLVHPETAKKVPSDPDQEFSLFSETHNELRDIFASAKNFRSEVSVDFESRKRNLQLELSRMINEETESQSQTVQNSHKTTPDFHQQAKTFIKHRTANGNTPNPLDKDYQRFVDDLLAEQYAPRCADFRNVEEIIAFLDHKSIEADTSTARHIAPFNSNLPVLNISKCVARHQSVSNTSSHPKGGQSKLYSSLLKPISTVDTPSTPLAASNSNSKKTSNAAARRVPKKSEEGRALMVIEKSSSRRQSKKERGRRSNRPKPIQSGDSVIKKKDSIEGIPQFTYSNRGPPLLETPTNISAQPTPKPQKNISHDTIPVEDLRQLNDRIERDMHDLLLQTDDSLTIADPPSQVKHESSATISQAPHSASSQEIFLMNLKTLQQQTSSAEQQQRLADEQQRVMTTLFLRQNFSATKLTQHQQTLPFQQSTFTQLQSLSNIRNVNPTILAPSNAAVGNAASQPRLPCQESTSSIGDLEQQALNQYRTSDESIMEAEFTRLEREAQEQYPY